MKGKKIVVIIVLLVAIYLVLALIGPSNYRVTRSLTINASLEQVYEQTSLFKNWEQWSPWAKADSAAVYTIEKDDQTPGAKLSWIGTTTGVGNMTSVEVIPNQKFIYDLEFIEPWYMAMTSHGGFVYSAKNDSVELMWYDEGDIPFMSRPMMLFFNVEAQIGPMFEQGLADIKTICEGGAANIPVEINEVEVSAKSILYIVEGSTFNADSLALKMEEAYGELMVFIQVNKLSTTGMPMNITTEFSLQKMYWGFNAALPVEIPEETELIGRIKKGFSYEGKAVKGIHIGSYTTSIVTYNAIEKYMEEHGLEENGMPYEEFVDDPGVVAEKELRTFIYFPVK